jgi:hypothetical protein
MGLVFDVIGSKLEAVPAPTVPLPPKYDARLSKKGGFVWMSEMLLADLEWWHARKEESANGGGKYAEKDAKTVTSLAKWIAWRKACPSDVWSGTRNDATETAAAPSRSPALHSWDDAPKRGTSPAATGSSQWSDEDYSVGSDEPAF